MPAFINEYKVSFFLTWIFFYIIFPAWTLPVSESARAFVYFGLIIYFIVSLKIMNQWFSKLSVDKPFIVKSGRWPVLIHNNVWFFIICFMTAIFHVYQIVMIPALMFGDEPLHLLGGLWIYNYIDGSWHHYLQYVSWILLVLILWKRNTVVNKIKELYSLCRSKKQIRNLSIIIIVCLFSAYFILLKDLTHYPGLVRYPPLSRVLYFASYFYLGIDHIWPRILQLACYLFSAIYIYRIIKLFGNEDQALLGASVYLFLPIVSFYAHTAELANGTNLFIVMISYYFLRFIDGEDNRDLLLTSYLIGTGFLYKRIIFLMFFICSAYLVLQRMKGKDIHLGHSLKVLLISLVPIIPWMIIGKLFTWRNYKIVWPHLYSLDRHFAYLSLLPVNMSWILFLLFIAAVIWILTDKKNQLIVFSGFLFICFYLFLVADWVPQSARLAMALYPTVAIYVSELFSNIINRIKWKHAFKTIYSILILYLIVISSISPLNEKYYLEEKSKVEYYPSESAMKWINDNVKEGEKILTLRILTSAFYAIKLGISSDRIVNFMYDMEDVSDPGKLDAFCKKNNITYIMFPYSTKPSKVIIKKVIVQKTLMHLIENRNREYLEVANFNLGDNHISICKIIKS